MARDSPQVGRPAGGSRQRGSGGEVAASGRSAPWTGTGRASGPVSLREKKKGVNRNLRPHKTTGDYAGLPFLFSLSYGCSSFHTKDLRNDIYNSPALVQDLMPC